MVQSGKILLYYKYILLRNTGEIRNWQRQLCIQLKLKGRVIIASEGINGTVGGSDEAITAYVAAMKAHPLFADVDFKESEGGAWSFPRMRIVIRNQIVHWGKKLEEPDLLQRGIHLQPQAVHELLTNKPENLLIFDARNVYESRIGAFENALKPSIDKFRDLPEYIDENLDIFKGKQVLMYCTGGIRCEPASAYLKSKGVAQEVYQVQGGIHRYVEQYPEGYFRGKNYVFDGRCAVSVTADVLTTCDLCQVTCDEYVNCTNAECNEQFIACEQCQAMLKESCSKNCFELVQTGKVVKRAAPARLFPPTESDPIADQL